MQFSASINVSICSKSQSNLSPINYVNTCVGSITQSLTMEAVWPAFGWRRKMWSQAQSEVYKMPDMLLGESQIEKNTAFKILPQVIGWCIDVHNQHTCAIKINNLDSGCGLMCSPSLHLDSTMYAMYEWMEIWSRSVHLKCALFRQSLFPTNLLITCHIRKQRKHWWHMMTSYDLPATFHLTV